MSLFSSTRRGFFGGLIGGVGALQGLLTGATPPVVPTVKLRPIDPKQAKLFEFLNQMFLEGREFFLQGDIGGFTSSLDMNFGVELIDVTCFQDRDRKFVPAYQRLQCELIMGLESEQGFFGEFKLESTMSDRSKSKVNIFRDSRINPDDLPKRSCMIPLGREMRDSVVFEESRFFVRRMESRFTC